MTRDQFNRLLQNPATIDLNFVSDLEEITRQFPYFTNAHILLAKQYHGHENIRYENYLRKASAYAPDRTVLYQLIRTTPLEIVHIKETETEVERSEQRERETVRSEETETERSEQREQETERSEETETETVRSEQRELETVHSEETETETGTETESETDIQPLRETITSNPTHSFLDWLKIKSVPVIPAEEMADFLMRDHGYDEIAHSTNRTTDLIDKFIQSEPRIIAKKSEFYSPGNMARASATEPEDLVSETLARIYAQQGNIPKAIEAYYKLGLKFPEKNSYFAALIQELEGKQGAE